jgi:hypothetical protein
MSSVVQICNMALARIGVSSFISNLNEATNEARICSLFYEPMRDFALRDGLWNFAKKQVLLADAGTPPEQWAYKYALPDDFLKARTILMPGTPVLPGTYEVPGQSIFITEQRVRYEIANEGGQKVLLTNQPKAMLVYTARVEDTTLYDPIFVSALSYLLASEIAMPLAVQPNVAKQARDAYMLTVSTAAAHSMNEAYEGQPPESEFTMIRR